MDTRIKTAFSLWNLRDISIPAASAYVVRMATEVCTIGYAGRSVDDFIATLKQAHVVRVVDVRELPLSRRRGFSKTKLGEALRANGIEYVHVRRAGNPHRKLKVNIEQCLAMYAQHVDADPAIVDDIEAIARSKKSALLCFEACAAECHRSVLAERLELRRMSVRNL